MRFRLKDCYKYNELMILKWFYLWYMFKKIDYLIFSIDNFILIEDL